MLVSAVQQRESAVGARIPPPSWVSVPPSHPSRSSQSPELASCLFYKGLCLHDDATLSICPILSPAVHSVESCPKATGASPIPRPQKWSQNQGHLQSWLSPSVTIAKSLLIITSRLPDSKVGKDAHSSKHPILTDHLMATFQQKFSLSWGCKNWLLTHNTCQLSLVCQEVGPRCSHYLCSLFL